MAFIGANKAVMKFEDIRVQRQMRGKVNRLVNCKAANLNKTLNASVEQIDAIRKLQQNGKFNKLEDNLKEIANLEKMLEHKDRNKSKNKRKEQKEKVINPEEVDIQNLSTTKGYEEKNNER